MTQEILRVVFRYLHIVGAAAVLGGMLAALGNRPKQISSLVLHGAATQFVTGLVLMFITMADADHLKITVKIVLLGLLLVLFIVQRRKGELSNRAYLFDLGLVLVIIAVAVFWRDYGAA